ncbi:MAG TPA: diadenosine tetraphosphate hydrolase [Pseudoneobacillus sp.]|nr:diadenosine tetraphosphate hydrolase [Pseudoneobacillus sp.]
MRKITFADGRTVETSCLSCGVANGLIEATGGVITETPFFHAHQDIAYPIPGLVILAAKRHFYTMDELTDEEAADYIALIRKIRKAQREVFGIEHVYYFYNEDTTHHFHLWMVPRYEWMNELGRSVESLRPVLRFAREHHSDPESIQKVKDGVQKLAQYLAIT